MQGNKFYFRREYTKEVLGALLVAVGMLGSGTAQKFQEYTFADIAWLSSPSVVASTLGEEGYTVDTFTLDENDRFNFSGSLLGKDVYGIAQFDSQQQLVKIVLYLLTGDIPRATKFFDAEETYLRLKGILVERYGAPTSELEAFSDPYYRGDGYETQAVELDEATFTSL